MTRKAVRWIAPMLLMGVGPPLTWLAILWSDPMASGIRGPALVYGLAALSAVPGLIGLSMLPLRGRTKVLILPLYLTAVVLVLLYTLLVFVCVATHDCP
jgi:hypothetical protein